MNEKAAFSKRLIIAMERAGYPARPSVLEREFNSRYWGRSVSIQAVSRWLRGLSIPEQDKLQVLAEWLRVSPQALRFGDKAVSQMRESTGVWENPQYSAEREVFEAYLTLPLEQRKIIREVILAFVNKKQHP